MAGNFGDSTAQSAIQGRVNVIATAWTPIVAGGGTTNYPARRHVRLQSKSNPGGAMALEYVSPNADGTYTTPTTSVKLCTIMPGNSTWIEPIGDKCMIFGKLVKKKGFSFSSISVVVTEYR